MTGYLDLIDITEEFASRMKFSFLRSTENKILVSVMENNVEYKITVTLREDADAACFSCDLGLSVPQEKLNKITESVRNVNEQLLVGRFELSEKDTLNYLIVIPFVSNFMWDENIMESVFSTLTTEAERFFQYFSMIISEDAASNTSLSSFFMEPMGYA